LHADFDRFEGTQEDVGDEFCGCRSAEVDDCLGGVGEEFLAVVVFEDFVGAVFSCALEGVAGEGWGLWKEVLVLGVLRVVVGEVVRSYPAEEDTAKALFCEDAAPCLQVGLVDARVDLTAAFDEIERGDCGVSWAAGWGGGVSWGSGAVFMWLIQCTNDAADGACCEVVAAEELDLLLGFRERSHDVWFAIVVVVECCVSNGVSVGRWGESRASANNRSEEVNGNQVEAMPKKRYMRQITAVVVDG
jgi:hypothetical protein